MKGALDKQNNRIKLVNQVADSKNEKQTALRKIGEDSDSQSDFDDLEFADISSED